MADAIGKLKELEARVKKLEAIIVRYPTSGGNVLVQFGASPSLDAFGRLRSSGTGQRGDFTFTNDKLPLSFDEVPTLTGTATHDTNLRAVYLSTGGNANTAGMYFCQHYYNPYTAGNSHQVRQTGNLNPDNLGFENAVSEMMLGDLSNGLGIRYTDGTAYLFVRSSISGAAADLHVAAASTWDCFDNTQPDYSAENAAIVQAYIANNWSNSLILDFDLQSLATGTQRFFLDADGKIIRLHSFHNDNVRVGPYWQRATLPLCWRVYNDAAATETSRMLAICGTVKSEGGADLNEMKGYPFGISNRTTAITVGATLVPVISIRAATTFNGLTNRFLALLNGLTVQTDNPIHWRLLRNATLTAGGALVWNAVDANSFIEYNVNATGFGATGTNIGPEDYAAAGGGTRTTSQRQLSGKAPISLNAAGTAGDIITLAAVRTSASNAAVYGGLSWDEIR